MKKIVRSLVLVVMALVLTGCSTNMSYTYGVETGDSVKITLDTTDGYSMTSSLPFTISLGSKDLSQGSFIKGEYYSAYVEDAGTNGVILEKGSKGDAEYVFYQYNGNEYNYVISLKNSKTGIVIGNTHSKEEAKLVFDLLSFELVK